MEDGEGYETLSFWQLDMMDKFMCVGICILVVALIVILGVGSLEPRRTKLAGSDSWRGWYRRNLNKNTRLHIRRDDQDYLGRPGYATWYKDCWSLLMGFGFIVS
jgi:hypothetical protein